MHAQRAGLLLLIGVTAGCPEPNPNFIEPSGSEGSTGSVASTTGAGASSTSGTSGPVGTGDGGSGTTGQGTTSSTDSTTAFASSTTSEFVELGFPCTEDAECDESIGAECCTEPQCLDTCMVPCDRLDDCPMGGMSCAHGYCLFTCDNDDADCRMWPDYTCQHFGNTLCEKD